MNVGHHRILEQIAVTAGGPVHLARELPADATALVFEPFTGEGLDALLACRPLLSLPLALQAARAAAALHAAGIVHSDLRPVSFLVARAGDHVQLKLADLSRAMARDAVALPHTRGGRDWAYLSPGQTGRMQRPADYRTDFHSLGILPHRLFTGELPFQADDPLEWVHGHLAGTLGMNGLREAAIALEVACDAEDRSAIDTRLQEVSDRIEPILNALQSWADARSRAVPHG